MTDQREPITREWFRRLSDREFSRLGELLTEDAQMELIPYDHDDVNAHTTVEYPNPLEGREAIVKIFTASAQIFDTLSFDMIEFYPAENSDAIVVEYTSEGICTPTRKRFHDRYAAIMRIRNGQIYLWREYHDANAFTRAMTPDPV